MTEHEAMTGIQPIIDNIRMKQWIRRDSLLNTWAAYTDEDYEEISNHWGE